jgi:hypothetical protein
MCGEQTGTWSVVNRLPSLLSFLFAEVTRLRASGGQLGSYVFGNVAPDVYYFLTSEWRVIQEGP